MVLLKNNGLLPLKGPQHIAVIGRSAENAHFQGGGSSHINPTKVDVPFKALQARAETDRLIIENARRKKANHGRRPNAGRRS